MRQAELVITVASWEERFVVGLTNLLSRSCPKNLIMYYFVEYADHTKDNRQKIEGLCEEKDIGVDSYQLTFKDQVRSWLTIYDTKNIERTKGKVVTVDFTTMPRETLWTLFDLLDEYGAIIQYVYHTPERYSNEWLSRDPGRPRIVYKLGGEAKLGLSTILLVLTGYDPDRVDQLIRFFDPYYTLLGVQTGEQFNNQTMNVAKYKHYLREPGVEVFDLDAYTSNYGFDSIEARLQPYLDKHNIIMSSLGPKLSAIALYQLHKKYPQTALAYAPSNEFNLEYSFGIGKTFTNLLVVGNDEKTEYSKEAKID